MRVAKGVREEPLTIHASWMAREYATRIPTPTTFQNWTLCFEIASVPNEVLVARYLRSPGVVRSGKTHRSGADTVHVVDLTVQWNSYGSSDLVTINFTGGNDLSVEDREFGLDPQRWVGVALPEAPTTGSVISLATISRLGDVEIGIVCLVKDDTTNTHGRWAIKEALREGLLSGYDFLASGAVSGELPQTGSRP